MTAHEHLRRIVFSARLYFVVRVALALLFVYGGAAKLIDPKAFARLISHYGLVPDFLLPVVAVGLPVVEVLAGIALVMDLRAGLYAVSALLVLFITVLGFGVAKNLEIDCGCFGPEDLAAKTSLVFAFWRDMGLIVIAAFLNWSRIARGRHRVGYIKSTHQKEVTKS